MTQETSIATVNDRRKLQDFVKNARIATEFTKTDFAYIAVGSKDNPAEVQTPNGDILRGEAILFYGKNPRTPRTRWADLK